MNRRQKVLAVDDEARNLKIISLSLADEWDLEMASTGEEALEAAAKSRPDLLLMDIMMPDMDGYEVCRRLRRDPSFALTKVILVSGRAMIEERLKGYEVGADDYLTKPFAPEELQAKVRVFLRLSATERKFQELNQSLEEKVRARTQQLLDAKARMIQSARLSALGEMAAGIAHEVNNPLAIIHTLSAQLCDMAEDEPIDRAGMARISRAVVQTTERIAKIVGGLKSFSRDGTKDPFQKASVKKVLEDTLALCTQRFKHHSIELNAGAVDPGLSVECREAQIGQVLLNLLNNAYDAIKDLPEKWIRIETADQGDEIEIRVTDSGRGIPEPVRERLFEPFFTTKPVGNGTGLGLSISRGIVESHQGSLRVDGDCANTRFVLRLPKKVARKSLNVEAA